MICKPKSTDIEVDIEKLEKRVQKILD